MPSTIGSSKNHIEQGKAHHVITWEMPLLRDRLAEKHPQTFWVGAQCQGRGADEHFHYVQVQLNIPGHQKCATLMQCSKAD
ncbi:MAG: hypothetical protein E5Y77_18845 [Mesorhizobium sp.]|nr:MAG: hypothetical protein E5Y77_18845 [Mesorhizobium sp.]